MHQRFLHDKRMFPKLACAPWLLFKQTSTAMDHYYILKHFINSLLKMCCFFPKHSFLVEQLPMLLIGCLNKSPTVIFNSSGCCPKPDPPPASN